MIQSEIKTLFWNIGNSLSDEKLELISEAIEKIEPDIFCIAEGTISKKNCSDIENAFLSKKYICYYSPLFSENKAYGLGYNYNGLGLKVFRKKELVIDKSFTFTEQREDGRIIILKCYHNFRPITFVFLHNRSKEGVPDETLDQVYFLGKLREMIEISKIGDSKTKNTEEEEELQNRVVIIGDFNLEPWDRVLKHKKFLSTSFFKSRNHILQRNKSEKHFYNPVVDLLSKSEVSNLNGTYYSDTSGWALFDYVLYDTNDGHVDYEIITEFENGRNLLNKHNDIVKKFLNHDIDHLPILIKIKN